MNEKFNEQLPADLAEVSDRLEQSRPSATALELDQIKLRAQRQAGRTAPFQPKGQLLKSRMAIMSVLALGILMSGTGATLAVSGSSESGDAGQAQYPNTVTDKGGSQGGDTLAGAEQGPDSDAPADTPSPSGADTGGQANEQAVATSSGSSLPFTGLAAIPLLVLGLAMLGGGAVLQRRSRNS